MTEEKKSTFAVLSSVDVGDKIKEKNKLRYLPWSSAWAEVKKRYPDAKFHVYKQIMDDGGNTRPWHTDDKSGWVEVGVTIDGEEIIETLAIMNLANKAIPVEDITSVDANKSIKRCLVKCIALHGLGLYIYESEDLPEELTKIMELQEEIAELVKKKCSLSDAAKAKVKDYCVAAEKSANPQMEDDEITGNYKNIDDFDVLEKLKRQLMAVRK